MTVQAQEIAEMIDMMPEKEQDFAVEVLRKLFTAWDSDYTKVTPAEAKAMEQAEKSGWINAKDIDWDNIEKYA